MLASHDRGSHLLLHLHDAALSSCCVCATLATSGPHVPICPWLCLCVRLWQMQAHGQFPCSNLLQQWVPAFTTSTAHAAAPLNGHALADVTIIDDLEPADVPCGFVHGPFRLRILAYEVGCSSNAGHQVWVSRWLVPDQAWRWAWCLLHIPSRAAATRLLACYDCPCTKGLLVTLPADPAQGADGVLEAASRWHSKAGGALSLQAGGEPASVQSAAAATPPFEASQRDCGALLLRPECSPGQLCYLWSPAAVAAASSGGLQSEHPPTACRRGLLGCATCSTHTLRCWRRASRMARTPFSTWLALSKSCRRPVSSSLIPSAATRSGSNHTAATHEQDPTQLPSSRH